MSRIYSAQKPDSQDNGTFCGTYKQCLEYIAKWYSPIEVDEMNDNAEYHGWQIAEIEDETDYCYDVTPVSSEDII